MNVLKKYFIPFLFNIILIILIIFILTIIYYYNYIDNNTYNFLKLFILLVSIFIYSFFIGRKTKSKGYLSGIKYSLLFIIPTFIISLINSKFQFKLLLFYLMIISSSTIGSMFGISIKKLSTD